MTNSMMIAITNNAVIASLIKMIITLSTHELVTLFVMMKSCILMTEDHK